MNHTASEDLFQDTLIKVWNNIGKYKDQNKFASWLFSIAHNIAIDYLRKIKYEQKLFSGFDDPAAQQSGKDHHNQIESQDILNTIEAELNTLPTKQKEVFLLRQFSGMTFKEIAAATDQPLNTVLSHMHYAMTRLKNVLREKR